MGLDLNLLVPLEALLQERSVSRAAERLGLSQPTVSAALAPAAPALRRRTAHPGGQRLPAHPAGGEPG
ncbi:LysR family transcriptional regulator [Streptomyces aurantiogriseus]|uniref:LysR family transcriptional regulator n=1 Tax=Streptomyces aurantiogriseus TaxID=66870 RepID=UPI00357160E7